MNNLFAKISLVCMLTVLFVSCANTNKGPTPDFSFPFSFKDNRIILVANIDGSFGKYIFDTGCEGIITSTPIINLSKTTRPYDRLTLLGSTKKYDAYAIDKIEINSTIFPVSTFVLHSDTKLVGFDGFIGLSVFKGYYVEVSFTKNTISLYKDKPKGYSKYIQVFFDKQSCPYVQVAIDGITSPFLFDTGNPLNIVFPLPIASSIDRKKYQRIISLDKDYESYRVNIESYDDGFRVYKNITGDSNPPSTLNNSVLYSRKGNLGLDYIKHRDFVIDNRGTSIANLYYRNRSYIANFYIGRKGTWSLYGRPNAQYNNYGISGWTVENNKLLITSVIENGKAITAGIIPETEVLQINKLDTNSYSYRKIDDFLLFTRKKTVLTCVINNQPKDIVLQDN